MINDSLLRNSVVCVGERYGIDTSKICTIIVLADDVFYPAWMLFGLFPMNIRLDDIFLVCLFIGSLIKSGGRPRVTWPVVAAFLFCILIILGGPHAIFVAEKIQVTVRKPEFSRQI